jgi:hypothetical protein
MVAGVVVPFDRGQGQRLRRLLLLAWEYRARCFAALSMRSCFSV